MKFFVLVSMAAAVASASALPQYTFSSGGGRGSSSRLGGRLQEGGLGGSGCRLVNDIEYVDKYDTVCDTKYE